MVVLFGILREHGSKRVGDRWRGHFAMDNGFVAHISTI
jgi:hypothetical protein